MPSARTSASPVEPSPVTMFTVPGGSSAWRQTSAKRSAVSGVVSAGLRTTVFPQARAGATFQASINSGKFQGMICAATPSGCGAPVGEGVLQLVRPAGVVEEVGGRQRQVDVARLLDRLAAVQRLGHRQLAASLLEDAGDPEEVLGPARRLPGRPLGKCPARRLDGERDVLGAALRDLGQRLLAGRRKGREPLAGARLHHVAADEEAVALLEVHDLARLRRRCVQPVGGLRTLFELVHVSRW